jgi:hypothetical protein
MVALGCVMPEMAAGAIHGNALRDPATGCIIPLMRDGRICLSCGLTVSEADGAGVGIVPLDSPLVSLGRPGLYSYEREWKDPEPEVFINLFNNIWGTNFRQWREITSAIPTQGL